MCILVSCAGEWSWDELHDHEQTTLTDMLAHVPQSAKLLLDLKHGVWIKPDSLQDEIMRSGQFHSDHGIVAVAFVVSDAAIGTLLLHLHQKHGSKSCTYYHTNSLERARDLLKC